MQIIEQLILDVAKIHQKLDILLGTRKEPKKTRQRRRNANGEVKDVVFKLMRETPTSSSFILRNQINDHKLTSFPVSQAAINGAMFDLKTDNRVKMLSPGIYQLVSMS